MGVADFSYLPEVVWADIFTYLSLKERSQVARTCHRLNDMFNHPAGWQTVNMSLLQELREPGTPTTAQYFEMAERFGSFIRDLTISVIGQANIIGEPCLRILEQLASNCRPNRLTLCIGEGVTAKRKPNYEHLFPLNTLISESDRLHYLNLVCWPFHQSNATEGFNVLEFLLSSCKCRNLQHLKLFATTPISFRCSNWIPLNHQLPTASQTAVVISVFSNLQTLSLNSFMFDKSVLEVLSKKERSSHLRQLDILVLYHRGRFPDITSACWKSFIESNPAVVVSVTLANTIPLHEATSFLKSEVPLVSLTIFKYARYNAELLYHLGSVHNRLLRQFVDYDPERIRELEVKELVMQCQSMDTLVYHGGLHKSSILDLVSLPGRQWKRFEVSLTVFEADFGDEVLVQAPNGEFMIASHLPGSRFYHTDESENQRQMNIDELSAEVSEKLGIKWRPLYDLK